MGYFISCLMGYFISCLFVDYLGY